MVMMFLMPQRYGGLTQISKFIFQPKVVSALRRTQALCTCIHLDVTPIGKSSRRASSLQSIFQIPQCRPRLSSESLFSFFLLCLVILNTRNERDYKHHYYSASRVTHVKECSCKAKARQIRNERNDGLCCDD